jgi:hypothetical protein
MGGRPGFFALGPAETQARRCAFPLRAAAGAALKRQIARNG